MEIKVLKDENNELKIQLDSITIVEILRIYLNEDPSVKFAAWNREHPSKPAILLIKTSGKTAKKALQDSISKIDKDVTKVLDEFKKAK